MQVLVTSLEGEGRDEEERGGGADEGRVHTRSGTGASRIYLTESSHLRVLGWKGVPLPHCQKAFRRLRACIYRHLRERPSALPAGRQEAVVCQVHSCIGT